MVPWRAGEILRAVWFAAKGVLLAAAMATIAMDGRAAAQKGGAADWQWAHEHGTALLVLEPPPLRGIGRWVMESPRHRGALICTALSPDGTTLATAGTDAVVRLWNLQTGALDRALAGHSFHLHTMAWSPDGTLLATHAWGDLTTRLWNVADGTVAKTFKLKTHLRSLCWSGDSRKLAGATDGSGRIYVSEGREELSVFSEAGQPVRAVEWSPDGSLLAVAAVGSPVALIDAASRSDGFVLDGSESHVVTDIRFSPDGKRVATSGAATTAIWERNGGPPVATIDTAAAALAWAPDNARIATVSAEGVTLWKAADGAKAGALAAPGHRVEWSAATGRIVVASSRRIEVWQPEGTAAERTIDAAGSTAPLFQPGRPVITGMGTATLSLWDPRSFARQHRLEGHGGGVTAAAWSRDGKRLATAATDGKVRFWNARTGEAERVLTGHRGSIACLAWSGDGRLLASAGADRTVRIWNADGAVQAELTGHTKPVRALAWAPGGAQLVTGGADEQLIVWDAAKREQVKSIPSVLPITALAWGAGKGAPAVACGFADGSIRVVNPLNGEMLAMVADGGASRSWPITALDWMPGNQLRLLSSRFYLTRLWDIPTATSIQRQLAPGGASEVFSTAAGVPVVARANDRTVRFWDPVGGSLRGSLLEEGDSLVAVSTTGDVKCGGDAAVPLIAIVETPEGQRTIPLDTLAKEHGWKNNGRVMKLPAR